jgi:tetratricopeptide (TPR) repeat protein
LVGLSLSVVLARPMSHPAKSRVRFLLLTCLCFADPPCSHLFAQQGVLGSIIGHVRTDHGEVPPQRILVTLEYVGAPRDSVYTDSQGTYGFHNLSPGPYSITVNDQQYETLRRDVAVPATSLAPTAFLDITLIPKATSKSDSASSIKLPGANPNMVDAREYSTNFPKSAVKEFKKGQESDGAGKRDDAIRHYQKAIAIAPDYYFAHNNLGSDYMSKSDLASARREFERVIELNQSDSAAYFNLSNVCMLSGQLPDAKRYLDEGMRREPDSALGQFLLGSLNLRLGKLPEAESALRRTIQMDPFMAQARLQLVNLLLKLGRKQDALSQLRDFLSSFPGSSFSPHAKQLVQRLEAAPLPAAAIPN